MNMLREYLGNNKLYQQSGFHKKQKLGVNKKSVILTCMDSRCAGFCGIACCSSPVAAGTVVAKILG